MLRPQPIGIFPPPVGYLLLPESLRETDFQRAVMHGQKPLSAPPEAEFYVLALNNEFERAIEKLLTDNSILARYNFFVLQPDEAGYKLLQKALPPELQPILEAAAFTLGMSDVPPLADNLDNEILAFVALAQATAKLEENNFEAAQELLRKGIDAARAASPILAAQLMSALAETMQKSSGASAYTVQLYKNALDNLKMSDLSETRAALWLSLGMNYQELSNGNNRGALLEAVRCYQEALQTFGRETHPEQFAWAQNNLALAYLAMPMTEASDQLRVGIAIAALRETLKIYMRETHPEAWASAQLNLANSLQYAPTSHPQENLMEAVNLYEEILNFRDKTRDPIGYARLLANQGNALAHLGVFDHAAPKLIEAKTIFEQNGEIDSAAAVGEVLAEIKTQRATAGNGHLAVAQNS